MSRLLFLGIIIFFAAYFVRRKLQAKQKKPQNPPTATNEKMVKCAHCGVHVPVSEAILRNDQHYYCDAHTPRA
jgi:uncharacterized protein